MHDALTIKLIDVEVDRISWSSSQSEVCSMGILLSANRKLSWIPLLHARYQESACIGCGSSLVDWLIRDDWRWRLNIFIGQHQQQHLDYVVHVSVKQSSLLFCALDVALDDSSNLEDLAGLSSLVTADVWLAYHNAYRLCGIGKLQNGRLRFHVARIQGTRWLTCQQDGDRQGCGYSGMQYKTWWD